MPAPVPTLMTAAEITDVYVRGVAYDGDEMTIDIAWSTRAHGCGVLTIFQSGGETFIRSQHLSSEFARMVLNKLVDIATVV